MFALQVSSLRAKLLKKKRKVGFIQQKGKEVHVTEKCNLNFNVFP